MGSHLIRRCTQNAARIAAQALRCRGTSFPDNSMKVVGLNLREHTRRATCDRQVKLMAFNCHTLSLKGGYRFFDYRTSYDTKELSYAPFISYNVQSGLSFLKYMVDRQSAEHVSARIQDFFFVMAVSNSCMDPLVYGSYAFDLRSFIAKSLRRICCFKKNAIEIITESGQGTVKTKTATLNGATRDKNARSRKSCRPQVRFEEASLCSPSGVCSDPLPKWGDHELQRYGKIKPSRSCEVFALEVAVDAHRYD
ncbi:hypothetical protein EVAR_45565_1 [Eumeta japonica]|uniref:Uncharacterized protein n=1 Tax=Eumeta variegata TaxID=151549 RepID=A0A4C1YR06_EUMVA|nr:hypothetical protein EVAR_45565_1 [Eumeta japonica]